MSGIGYPWNLNAREEEEEDEDPRIIPRARNARVENPTPLGYLPYNEHFALNRNHANPEGHYRRMYERPQYPFGPTPQINRAMLGPTPQLDRATRLVRAAPSTERAAYPFGSNYQADRSAFASASGFSPERIVVRSVDPAGQSPDPLSGSPMDRLLAVGTNAPASNASPPPSQFHLWDRGQWDRVTMTRPFLEAIDRNDVEAVKSIIQEHQRLTRCRIDPIHYAIFKGHFQLIPILISAGCDPNNVDMIGCTPLMTASRAKMDEVVDMLLEGGANPNCPSGRKQELPLIEAVYANNETMMKKLLARDDLDVDQTNEVCYEDETALTIAIYLGRVALVDALLQAGANPNVGRGLGKATPLHIAITAGAEQDCDADVPLRICELLLVFGAIPDSVDQNGFNPLHIAALNDRDDIMDMILNADHGGIPCDVNCAASEGETPLMVAVLHGSSRCVAKLLSAGCDFTSNDDVQGNPGSSMISKAYHLGYFTIVKMLMTAGASYRNKRIFVRMPRTNLGSGFQLLNRLQQYQSLLLFLDRRGKTPPSLHSLSVLSIRNSLKMPLVSTIPALPLPNKMKPVLFIMDELKAQMELEPMGHPSDGLEDSN